MYWLTHDISKQPHPSDLSEAADVLDLCPNGWARHSTLHTAICFDTPGSGHPLMTFQLTLTLPCYVLQVLRSAPTGRRASDAPPVVAPMEGLSLVSERWLNTGEDSISIHIALGCVTYSIPCTTGLMDPLAEYPSRRIGWDHCYFPPQIHLLWRLGDGRDSRCHPHVCYVGRRPGKGKWHVYLELG